MKHLFNTIFPRPVYQTYFNISLSIGVLVAFILLVFQPFGTANFKHNHKFLILSGYGLVVSLFLIIYFYLSIKVLYKKIEKHWTIVYEVLDIFISMVLSIILCYVYASVVIFDKISIAGLMSFSRFASSVAFFPTVIYLAFLYGKWKDVAHSVIEFEHSAENKRVKLVGINKNGFIETSIENIIFAQAQDNYVILLIENNNKTERHILRSTLKRIKAQLSAQVFIQCHRSFVVNKDRILAKVGNKNKAHINLSGTKKEIPVSRSYFDLIL